MNLSHAPPPPFAISLLADPTSETDLQPCSMTHPRCEGQPELVCVHLTSQAMFEDLSVLLALLHECAMSECQDIPAFAAANQTHHNNCNNEHTTQRSRLDTQHQLPGVVANTTQLRPGEHCANRCRS